MPLVRGDHQRRPAALVRLPEEPLLRQVLREQPQDLEAPVERGDVDERLLLHVQDVELRADANQRAHDLEKPLPNCDRNRIVQAVVRQVYQVWSLSDQLQRLALLAGLDLEIQNRIPAV